MSYIPLAGTLKVESIFHPSDFSEGSAVAFRHALKLALVTRSTLFVLHVSMEMTAEWQDFPGVRDTLERWGLIPKDSSKSAVAELGIQVRKILAQGRDPVRACVRFLENHSVDLIVLAVHQREGKMRWLNDPVGEAIASQSEQMTLFVPHGVEGFVSAEGVVSLQRILVPIAAKPRPQPAIEAVHRMISALQLPAGKVVLLHVGSAHDAPAVTIPTTPGWNWERVPQEGDVVESILKTAQSMPADLVVMTTDGPDGFLDALRGSTSERVLREINCPLLNLPAGSLFG